MKALKLLALILIIWGWQSLYAATCQVSSATCVDNVEPKYVGGKAFFFSDFGITDRCWDWQKTYQCEHEPTNHCAALIASGCTLLSASCKQMGAGNKCLVEQRAYKCGQSPTSTNNITIDYSYTLIRDSKDYSACGGAERNASCKLSGDICTEGPAHKVVAPSGAVRNATQAEIAAGTSQDGLVVYRDCWQWQHTYSCIASGFQRFCTPLKDAGCVEVAPAVCKLQGWDGSCLEYERTYRCDGEQSPLPQNIKYLNTAYSIIQDGTVSTCQDVAANPNCTKMGEVCLDGPATKVVRPDGSVRPATSDEVASGTSVDGAVVTKDCWHSETQYTCVSASLTSYCEDLESNPDCVLLSEGCIDDAPDGSCGVNQKIFDCKTGEDRTETVTDCGTQIFCSDGACFDTSYTPDTDFKLAVAMKEAMRQAGSYSIFEGEASYCEDKLWGAAKCCKSKGGGAAGKNSNVVGKMGLAGATYAGERVVEIGSSYMYDALFQYSASATYAFLGTATATAVEQGLFQASMPSAALSVYGVSWSASGALAGKGLMGANQLLAGGPAGGYLYFNPYMLVASVVMQVIMNYIECEEEEQKLSMKRGQDLCYRVGSWCSRKIAGSCEKRKQSWCCFPSVLGRVVNEQGRQQIGKSWGPKKSPDCSGFTEEELQKLRFDEMDLSEFLAVIVPNTKDGSWAKKRLEERVTTEPKSYYETKSGG